MHKANSSLPQLRNHVAITALILISVLFIASCDFVRDSYRVVGSVVLTVDFAKKGYLDLYDAGKITPEVDSQVEKAYTTYQDGARTTIAALRIYASIQSPTETDKAKVETALSQLRIVANSLLSLFEASGVNVNVAKASVTPSLVDSFVKTEAAKGVN